MDALKYSYPALLVMHAVCRTLYFSYDKIKWIALLALSLHFCFPALPQANCSSPFVIDICPDSIYTQQTNFGFLDDAPVACNKPGEDVCYRIHAPNGALKLYISVYNATQPYSVLVETANCGTGPCLGGSFLSGTSHMMYIVANAFDYYIWIDSQGPMGFDFSVGADTSTTIINVPNTKGNLGFDASLCALPIFTAANPFFQVQYNGVFQTDPMTLAPLYMQGFMCVTTFFKNTTGDEGIKQFIFKFAKGFTNVQCAPVTLGFYNKGHWAGTQAGDSCTFDFVDSAGVGRGDFDGSPNSCLAYTFCFSLTPITNNKDSSSVNVSMQSDKWGTPYSATIMNGCCPLKNTFCAGQNLLNGGGGGGGFAGNATSFGFGFNDPGSTLPITLLNFNVTLGNEEALVTWTTAMEDQNNYFSIERSRNLKDWQLLSNVKSKGSSFQVQTYSFTDKKPLVGTSYYRLRQTDFNGHFTLSEVVKLSNIKNDFFIYNNATGYISIVTGSQKISSLVLFDMSGMEVKIDVKALAASYELNISSVPSGIYTLRLVLEDGSVEFAKLINL
ncbi:MAG: T9SS type A sorting domain-containing protein [Bacteroidetes bacterium]|nr:T9SS type A sorting domain-containing protein [Bacteroidota bacterium]